METGSSSSTAAITSPMGQAMNSIQPISKSNSPKATPLSIICHMERKTVGVQDMITCIPVMSQTS